MAIHVKKWVVGAELQEFREQWPPGKDWVPTRWFGDDLRLEGRYSLEELDIQMQWRGVGEIPAAAPMYGLDLVEFAVWFRHWYKTRDHIIECIRLKKADVAALHAMCALQGWTILHRQDIP